MSHFTVLVIGPGNEEQLEEALYPFWELDLSPEEMRNDPRATFTIEMTPKEAQKAYDKFIELAPTQEQIDYAFDNLLKNAVPRKDGFFHSYSSPEAINEEKFIKWCEKNNLDPFCVKNKYLKSKYLTIEDYIGEWEGSIQDENGNWGYYRNDRCKWDWYLVGGRWAGYFRVKPGAVGVQGHHRAKDFAEITGEEVEDLSPDSADIVRVGDIDWDAMSEFNIAESKEYWEKAFEKYSDDKKMRKLLYGIDENDTIETYINRRSNKGTFAVVKKDENGEWEWYERGSMGFWGIVTDEKEENKWDEEFEKLIDGLDSDTVLTLVDCHI